jgi:hypothetical protein
VQKYLKNDEKFINYNILDITKKWKFLRKQHMNIKKPDPFCNKVDNPITEFDGLYILTTDLNYYPDDDDFIKRITTKKIQSNSTTPFLYKFIVVEAKHSITNFDITKKINQIKEFQEYIKYAKNFTEDNKSVKAVKVFYVNVS